MRLLPLLLVGLSLVFAGCSKEEDPGTGGDGTTTTTTTPTTTTPTGTTPTTTTTSGGNSTNSTTTPRTPMELCTGTQDFTSHAPTPPDPVAKSSAPCGTPAAGYTKINATVTWEAATAVPASASPANPAVKLVDSAGTAVGTCPGPSGPVQAPVVCTIAEAAIVAGEYTLAYEGTGNLKATVSVMVS